MPTLPLAVLALALLLGGCAPSAQTQVPADVADLLPVRENGGFEAFDDGWWTPPEEYHGTIDPAEQHGGVYAWRMDLGRTPEALYTTTSRYVMPGQDYRLRVWMRAEDVRPAGAVQVRLQGFAQGTPRGWIRLGGRQDLAPTDGTHGWKPFTVEVPAGAIPDGIDEVVIYLRAEAGATGTVWFDDLAFGPADAIPADVPAEIAEGEQVGDAVTTRSLTPARRAAPDERPGAFLRPPAPALSLRTGRDDNLFFGPEPARLTLHATAPEATRLTWSVRDEQGRLVDRGEHRAPALADLPPIVLDAPGYFEIRATLFAGADTLAALRTSAARLPDGPPPTPGPDYPLGTWVQQEDLFPAFGSRWTRVGAGWRWLEQKPGQYYEPLWQEQDDLLARYHRQGIEMIYLFHQIPAWAGPDVKLVAPENDAAFRGFVRKIVLRYRDVIDVWETMNEPYIPELFSGTLEDILRMHRIVYEEVHRLDPGARVIGPCLNPRRPVLFRQFRDLLDRGLGPMLDGVAIHTYGGLEAAGFSEDLAALRTLLGAYGVGGLPMYITEHGLSVPDDDPVLEQIQAQHLVRTLLLAWEADVKAVIWHMLSWPQGYSARERNFAVVRARTDTGQRAPRPAFVAASVAASVLGQARFMRSRSGFGPTTGAQVYADGDRTIHVLWEWGQPAREVMLPLSAAEATIIDLMGRRRTVAVEGGRLPLTLTPDPIYVEVFAR